MLHRAANPSWDEPYIALRKAATGLTSARDTHSDQLATRLATVEWGTLLGPGQLARVDLDELRSSGAFERVVQISPSLAYVQVTANPLDDLTGELERHLPRAREVLRTLLMDLSGVTLE